MSPFPKKLEEACRVPLVSCHPIHPSYSKEGTGFPPMSSLYSRGPQIPMCQGKLDNARLASECTRYALHAPERGHPGKSPWGGSSAQRRSLRQLLAPLPPQATSTACHLILLLANAVTQRSPRHQFSCANHMGRVICYLPESKARAVYGLISPKVPKRAVLLKWLV